jgi:ATP adenylyltransferase
MTYLAGADHPRERPRCVFCCKLEEAETEHVLYRGELVFVILNKFPYNNGHILVVPIAHVASIEDLPPAALTELMLLTNRSLAALRATYHPDGFNLGVNLGRAAGAGIAAHVHLHIVPRWNGDTNFMPVVGETRVLPETLDQTFKRLKPLFEEI